MMIRPLIAVLLLSLPGTASAQNGPPPTVSLAQYQAQLSQLDEQVADLSAHPQNSEALRKSLPASWTVTGGHASVHVSARFLDEALTAFQKEVPEAKKLTLKQLHTRLGAMRAAAGEFTQPSRANAAMRKRLDEILAEREFSGLRGPSLFEIWRDRIDAWLQKWWDKLFGQLSLKPPDFDWLGRIFVWLVIAAGASVLGVWLYRIYRRPSPEYTREIIPFAPSSKSWRIWLAEAREQAARGDWRNAIHLAYWASVSYLESSGLWIPDRARTPREYLRALSNADPKKPTFASLTRRFESIWYGSRRAGAADFDATVTELENLGCR